MADGRREIEIAASLDLNSSIIRSYLGKAYFEEKRTDLDGREYAVAKELDPRDPTPWFYDAIRKQTLNQPVEALHDLQKAIDLNDNRAVYRSKLMLDSDLAARSASLARIYTDLGFQQRALVEGYNSVNTDPTNHSAHRFLADSYSALPRHEIARVSELLQSQLLQPNNITPIQPRLAESNLLLFSAGGAADASFNEFNPLFNRDRLALQASGIVGENDTLGGEAIISGIHQKISYSVGYSQFETDGWRVNADQENNIANAFLQLELTHKTSIQAEARFTDSERGDLPLFFDPDNYLPDLREDEKNNSLRFGLHHAISPHSDLIASVMYRDYDNDISELPWWNLELDYDGYMVEIQYLFSSERYKIISGIGHFQADSKETFEYPPDPPMHEEYETLHTNLYIYSLINYPLPVTWTIGVSGDFFDDETVDKNEINPKVGLTWNPFSSTTLRAAVFRTFQRSLISSQTVEPTQVSGFNQFFDDSDATEAWRYGVGIDQKLSEQLFVGGEFTVRDLKELGEGEEYDIDEQLGRAYVYWTPHPWLAFSTEYQYEHFENPEEFMIEDIAELETQRVIFGVNFFHPCGFFAKLKPVYVSQEGKFASYSPDPPFTVSTVDEDDAFWVVDAEIGYRLPKRYGIVTLDARNIFNENFRFQDTDPSNPKIFPESLILAKFTLSL